MTTVARRTIDELATLYELEPGIRDVFVEGPSDRSVVEWYLDRRVKRRVSVREIDEVDVPSELLNKHQLDSGNRGCVIVLARELESRLAREALLGPTLIADADTDRVTAVTHECSILLFTDFSCLEMYLFNEKCFGKFLFLIARVSSWPVAKILKEMAEVLQSLFVIRFSNHILGYGMSWIGFEKLLTVNGHSLAFDEPKFVRRYLEKGGKVGESDAFLAEVNRNKGRLLSDVRHQMNGHDFLALSRWYVREVAGKSDILRDKNSCERAFVACLELEQLDGEQMFQRLLARLDRPTTPGQNYTW